MRSIYGLTTDRIVRRAVVSRGLFARRVTMSSHAASHPAAPHHQENANCE